MRVDMYNDIAKVDFNIPNDTIFKVILGGYIDGMSPGEMIPIWLIACDYICKMYKVILNSRAGIG